MNKKHFINTIIAIFFVLFLFCIQTLANNVDKEHNDSIYWKQRAMIADAIIDSIFNNISNAYIEDVLMETDTWDNYYILRYEDNNNSPVKEE